LWKNPPTQPVASLSELTKDMYGKIEKHQRTTTMEAERREREAVEGDKVVKRTTAPAASAVERITHGTKTLNHIIADLNATYSTTLPLRPSTHPVPETVLYMYIYIYIHTHTHTRM
jgi:hypothetical protein